MVIAAVTTQSSVRSDIASVVGVPCKDGPVPTGVGVEEFEVVEGQGPCSGNVRPDANRLSNSIDMKGTV